MQKKRGPTQMQPFYDPAGFPDPLILSSGVSVVPDTMPFPPR
jgi:hypothetical protein